MKRFRLSQFSSLPSFSPFLQLHICHDQSELLTHSRTKFRDHGCGTVATGGVLRLVAHRGRPCRADDGTQRRYRLRHRRQPGPVQASAGASHVPGDRRRGEGHRRGRAGRPGLHRDPPGREDKEVLGGREEQAQLLHAPSQRSSHHLERGPAVLDVAAPERRRRSRGGGAAERVLAGDHREAGAVAPHAGGHLRGRPRGNAHRPGLRVVHAGEPPAEAPRRDDAGAQGEPGGEAPGPVAAAQGRGGEAEEGAERGG